MNKIHPQKEAEWPATALGRQRREFLLERIRKIETLNWRGHEQPDPPSIARAKNLISEWEQKQRADYQKKEPTINKNCSIAREAVLFSETAQDALKAVQALERMCIKKRWSAVEYPF